VFQLYIIGILFVIFMTEVIDYNDNLEKIKKMVFAALFAALIAVGAYIRIPIMISTVPITLQTFFVLLAALVLGRKWGTVSVIVYLLVGFIGFPVFTGGSGGVGILFGPTGGYLYSFVLVAYLVGFFSEKIEKKPIPLFIILIFGSFLILGIGTIHLSVSNGFSIYMALLAGFVPFIIGDTVKSIAVALIAATVSKKIKLA
jgi:Uncharacterized conserved protein